MVDDNKNIDLNRIALKAGIWYVVSEIIIRGISFLTTPIFTRLLSTSVYGSVKIFDAWIYLFTPLLSLEIYFSVERAKFDFEEKYDSYLSSAFSLILIFATLVTLIFFPFRTQISMLLDCSEQVLWIIPAYAIFNSAILCLRNRDRQMMNYKRLVFLSFLTMMFSVIPAVLFVLCYKGKVSDSQMVDIRILSFYVPLIILGMVVSGIVFVLGKTVINWQYWAYGLRYSLPFIFYSISTQVLNQSDKIMIKWFRGIDFSAIFAVATTVVYIMDVINYAVHGAWLPWIFEKLNQEKTSEVQKVWFAILLGMGGLTWLIVILGPELILFLGGRKYESAVWLLGPMLTGSFIHFVAIGYTNLEKFYKKTNCVAITSLGAMIANIFLNYYFITHIGYRAAAYTTATAYLLSVFIHLAFVKKYHITDALRSRKTLWIIALFIALNLSSMLLYFLPCVARWGIVLAILIALFLKYKKELIGSIYRLLYQSK